jgi:chitinase
MKTVQCIIHLHHLVPLLIFRRVVCYWGTWANYRLNRAKFTPENIDASLCTNLVYAFAGLDKEKHVIKSLDPWMDLPDNYGLNGFGKATALKRKYPHLKV